MADSMDDDKREYIVLMNTEEQYSLWLASRKVPAGWVVVGPKGKKKECLEWVGKTWTDMRPKSLREAMNAFKAKTGG